LAAVGHERIVLWDVITGRKIRDFLGLRGEIHCVAISPDGQTLAAGIRSGGERSILLWDTVTGKELHALGEGQSVTSLAFCPDSKLVASASYDHEPIRLWSVATGKKRFSLSGLEQAVYGLAFSPDGRLLAGTGEGQTKGVCLWEMLTGQEVGRFVGPVGECVAFAPSGRTVASGGADSSVLLWDVTGGMKATLAQPARDSAMTLERLWDNLGGDAAKAHAAVWQFVAVPAQAVSLLEARLQPASRIDPQHIQEWIVALNSDRFAVREQAVVQLEKLGEQAAPALRKELAAQPALDLRRRIELVLEKLEHGAPGSDELRRLRAITVLEQIGDRSARQLLEKLSRGAPEARLTQEAKASLQRQTKEPAATP
jgi:hypothetical protein